MRPELHVDTEQRWYFAPIGIGLRHIEQTAKVSMAALAYDVGANLRIPLCA